MKTLLRTSAELIARRPLIDSKIGWRQVAISWALYIGIMLMVAIAAAILDRPPSPGQLVEQPAAQPAPATVAPQGKFGH